MEMDHTTAKLQTAADDLKKCHENVLHEDDLHERASSMTETQYQSLKDPLVGRAGPKDSAMLFWLKLSWNSADPNLGGNRLFVCLLLLLLLLF